MIRILFLDGCGTLWYPRATRRRKNPFWIYQDPVTSRDPDANLELTPGARETLEAARAAGVATVLLSTSPHEREHAEEVLRRRVRHFGLADLLDEVHATADHHPAKGETMLDVLERRGVDRREGLMVGDRYVWDYQPALDVGVRARLLRSAYEAARIAADPEIQTLGELDELLPILAERRAFGARPQRRGAVRRNKTDRRSAAGSPGPPALTASQIAVAPCVLFHYYHAGSLGHGRRVMALARALRREEPGWDIVVAAGGAPAPELETPAGVEVVQLPALTSRSTPTKTAPRFEVRPLDLGLPLEEVLALRRELLRGLCRRLRPRCLVTEFVPVGRRFLAPELLSLLRQLKRQQPDALALSSLRDMVQQPEGVWGPAAAREAGRVLLRHYDRVLVHGDAGLHPVGPELSCGGAMPDAALERLTYTGDVVHRGRRELARRGRLRDELGVGDRTLVLASAGGGADGLALLRCAARAEALLNSDEGGGARGGRFRVHLVGGPFLPAGHLAKLRRICRGREGALTVERHRPRLLDLLNAADVSVGMGGYNSCAELLLTRTPAVIVPRTSWEREQLVRARLLEGLGLARVLEPRSLTPEALAAAVRERAGRRRVRHGVDLGGAAFTARHISREVRGRGRLA